jgi:hypothetical protein
MWLARERFGESKKTFSAIMLVGMTQIFAGISFLTMYNPNLEILGIVAGILMILSVIFKHFLIRSSLK